MGTGIQRSKEFRQDFESVVYIDQKRKMSLYLFSIFSFAKSKWSQRTCQNLEMAAKFLIKWMEKSGSHSEITVARDLAITLSFLFELLHRIKSPKYNTCYHAELSLFKALCRRFLLAYTVENDPQSS